MERVIPERFLNEEHSLADFRRWAVINSLGAQGIATAPDINDYYRQNIRETRAVIVDLLAEDIVTKLSVSGWEEAAFALSDDLKTIEKLADKPAVSTVSTFLSPFDNLIWFRERMERLFGLRFRIEMYTPKAERNHGYYTMPILHGNRIVGIADPKVDRKSRTMTVHSINLLPDVKINDDLFVGLSKAIEELAAFTDCDKVELTRTTPAALKNEIELFRH